MKDRNRIDEMRKILNIIDTPAIGGDAIGARTSTNEALGVDIKKYEMPDSYGLDGFQAELIKQGFKGTYDDRGSKFHLMVSGQDVTITVGNENFYIEFPDTFHIKGSKDAARWLKGLKTFLTMVSNS